MMIRPLEILRLLVFCSLFACAMLANTIVASAQTQMPTAFSGSIAGDDTSTRFFIDFSQNIAVQSFYGEAPYRVIIDLEEVDFKLEAEALLEPRGLIEDVKVGRISKGRSRIVITLNAPAEIVRASMQKVIDEDYYRFLVDLERTEETRFASLLEAQTLVLGESGSVAEKGDRVRAVEKKQGRFTVVIDPGHGGIDGGAVGKYGTREKDVVLQFAKKLSDQIKQSGPFDVLMTRTEDVFLSLRQRLDFNRRNKADLFISVHADSLNNSSVRGSTIYTLSRKASDRLSEQLAEAENSVDLKAGIVAESDQEAITDILIDLTTRETKTFSKQFSRVLVRRLGEEVRLINNPIRSAAFGVLKAPDVPGVLLELGYLSNAEDEKLMKTLEWRQRAAKAVSKAVVDFFEPRM